MNFITLVHFLNRHGGGGLFSEPAFIFLYFRFSHINVDVEKVGEAVLLYVFGKAFTTSLL